MTPMWPLRSYRTLAALPNAAYCARRWTDEKMLKWRLGPLKETAELVVTELVTNAVAAMGGLDSEPHAQYELTPRLVHCSELVAQAYVRLRLSSDGQRLLVAVWDGSPQPPVVKDADTDAERGRGLVLVEALTERWGWYWVAGAPAPVMRSATEGLGRPADGHAGRDDGTATPDESSGGVVGKVVWAEVR